MINLLSRAQKARIYTFADTEPFLDRVEDFAYQVSPELGDQILRAVHRLTDRRFGIEFGEHEDEATVTGMLEDNSILVMHMSWQKWRKEPYHVIFAKI